MAMVANSGKKASELLDELPKMLNTPEVRIDVPDARKFAVVEEVKARLIEAGAVVTNGGRVLCATALGDSVDKARDAAYALCRGIHWDGAFYRKDIAWRALEREA